MSSEGINLIDNKLLLDELDSDEENDEMDKTKMVMESINQYTDEGMDNTYE
jgi:hypothetical protein